MDPDVGGPHQNSNNRAGRVKELGMTGSRLAARRDLIVTCRLHTRRRTPRQRTGGPTRSIHSAPHITAHAPPLASLSFTSILMPSSHSVFRGVPRLRFVLSLVATFALV